MSEQTDEVKVQIKYKDIEKSISGNVQEVWLYINKFLLELIPSLNIAGRLMLKTDLQSLIGDCDGIIAFSQEGPNLLIPRSKLTDNETLVLWLLANHVGFQLGILAMDSMSKEELHLKVGKSAKIANTRIGELVKSETIAKTTDDRYRITTLGIIQTQKDILPKIKARLSN